MMFVFMPSTASEEGAKVTPTPAAVSISRVERVSASAAMRGRMPALVKISRIGL